MLFNSMAYAVFLPIVFGLYWASRHRVQNLVLLVSSYVFYGAWDYRFLGLIAISTVVDYGAGIALGGVVSERRRRALLGLSLATNLGILAIFKYYDFFITSASDFLLRFGLEPNPPLLRVILPVGISFYTFQTISYTFDVYRRRFPPTRNLIDFATYVAFFPQLVAGPIERAAHLLPQIQRPRRFPSPRLFRSGLALILLGLFKKVAVADSVAVIAQEAFGGGGDATSHLLGLYAFALQIYCDFSGYSDIARGTSRLFGIELMRNFEQPYLSRSITEFWRRWHISLSTWLHDYLYVPLGGNKRGQSRTYVNLILTMLLGGLWHGAAWTFVVWGGLHGLLLTIHRRLGGYVPRGEIAPPKLRDLPRIVATFHIVAFLWIFFRAADLASAWSYLSTLIGGAWGVPNADQLAVLAFGALAITIIDVSQRLADDHAVIISWPRLAQGFACAIFVLAVVLWSGGEAQPFIYFQF